MTSRTSMLEDIRSGLAKSAPFEHLYDHLRPSVRKAAVPQREFSCAELSDRFATELATVGGEVHRVFDKRAALDTIGKLLDELNASRVAISDADLVANISSDSFEIISNPSREKLFTVEAGISAAQFAIAETGTLVLRSAEEKHRLVSLVPPVHICVLNSKNIRPSMHDVLEEMTDNIDPTITFITGPSRTSDIELTLAIGVHGPKRLIVILID